MTKPPENDVALTIAHRTKNDEFRECTFTRVTTDFLTALADRKPETAVSLTVALDVDQYVSAVNYMSLLVKCADKFEPMLGARFGAAQSPWRAYRRSVDDRSIRNVFNHTFSLSGDVSLAPEDDKIVIVVVGNGESKPILNAAIRMLNAARWCVALGDNLKLITSNKLSSHTFDAITLKRDLAAVKLNLS
jgi:hypothetical protein